MPRTTADGALAPYLRAARSHPWLVAAVTVVAVATSVLWVATRSHAYEGSSQVLVSTVSPGGAYAGLPVLTDSVDPTRTLQTAASVLDSSAAAVATAKAVPGTTARGVMDAVAVDPAGESNIVTVTATAGSADAAARLANAYTQSILMLRDQQLRNQVAGSIASLQAQQQALPPGDTGSATEIAGELSDLRRISDGHDPNFSLLQPAAASSATATGTSGSLIVVLALLAGLAIGLSAALALEHLNRRVRDEEELLTLYPLPVLARVPALPRGSGDLVSPELVPPRIQEAFQTLRVQLERDSDRKRAFMVTSPSMGDGKTTCAINLAMALTATRARVILMDLDLRKPDLRERLGADSDVTGLFRKGGTLENVLVEAPSIPGLQLLGARPQPNVIPLVEALTRQLPALIQEAHALADYVIIDTPPLGEVSDALRMAGAVDDVILVARPGHTDRAALQQTRELLDRMGQSPTGLVVVGVSTASDTHYGYGPLMTAPPEAVGPPPILAFEPARASSAARLPRRQRRDAKS